MKCELSGWAGEKKKKLPQRSRTYGYGGREARFGLVLSQRKCPFRTLDRSVNHESRREERNPLGSGSRTPAGWAAGPPPAVITALLPFAFPHNQMSWDGHFQSIPGTVGVQRRFVQSPTPTWFPSGSPQTGPRPERLHSSAGVSPFFLHLITTAGSLCRGNVCSLFHPQQN